MNSKIFLVGAAVLAALAVQAEAVVKNNSRIAFLGDSITGQGNNASGGFVNLVISGLQANGIEAVKIPAGIGGHKSTDMLKRLEKDVLSKKPNIMVLSCGVNDVWHGARGVKLPEYKKNIRAIVEKTQAAGIKVCILTATMIKEDAQNDFNQKLAAYNQFLKELASEKKCMLADLNGDMQKAIADFRKAHPKAMGNYLTVDGVHMNSGGNALMARGILKAFGLNEQELAKAEKAWQDKVFNIGMMLVNYNDLEIIAKKAAAKKMTIQEYVNYLVERDAAKK